MKRKWFLLFNIITTLILLGAFVHAIYRATQFGDDIPWWGIVLYWTIQVACLVMATFFEIGFWIQWKFTKKQDNLKQLENEDNN